jgi:hypothetical protein
MQGKNSSPVAETDMQAIVLQRILHGIMTLGTGNCRPLVGEIVVTERYDSTYSEHNSNYDIDNQVSAPL